MFKCCVCNKSPRREKAGSTRSSKSRQDGRNAEIEERQEKRDKLNGDVRSEKQTSISDDQTKNSDGQIFSEKLANSDKQIFSEKPANSDAQIVSDKLASSESRTTNFDKGSTNVENRVTTFAENADGSDERREKPEGSPEAKRISTSGSIAGEEVAERGEDKDESFDNERGSNGDVGETSNGVASGLERMIGNAIEGCAAKPNLYNASAYIERTIDDGPEEEGDDSVFEACPGENDTSAKRAPPAGSIPRWLSEEDDGEHSSEGCSGMQEPPATPVARDELALRRHRFFSDLLHATQNPAEHRVRFDPLGPMVHPGCETSDREEHLEELVNRLENVTRRLERVPTRALAETQETAVQTNTPSPKRSTSARTSDSQPDSPISSTQAAVPAAPASMSVAGYEDLVAGPVKEYLQLSKKIGGDVAAHSQLVEKAFQIQLQFIRTAGSRAAPANQSEQMSLLAPTSTQIQQIQEFREKNRGSPFFNHLSAISESIPALGWVAVSPTPAPYVKEMNDAGQFYTNRVLKDWKEKDKTHVEWCKAWVQTLTDLQQYVRQHHTTGLAWAKTGTAAPAGIPPPPPPSMPIGDVAPSVNDDRSALFAQINQGETITKNLKKVTSDMQTHKNPSLRTGPAPFKAPAASNAVSMKTVPPANAPIDKPPVFARDGKKWLVEYHKGNKDLVIDSAEMNNVIYMFRCQESTLVVKGKVNSIVMDSCRKSSVVFDSVVSSIEFVNCQSVLMQVLGKVPTVIIDKTDGCQMYLNSDSLDVELITSKSSEMNVMVPKGDGDYAEYPVPEQFKTTISPKGLSTIAVDSLG